MKNLILTLVLTAGLLPGYTQTTYTWNQAAGGNWATATNWTPSRTTPATTDILVINNGGTQTITNITTQTIGRLLIGGSSNITLTPNGGARTLTISNAGLALQVQAGSTLSLVGQSGGGTRSLTIGFAGAGNTVQIIGSLYLNTASNDPGILNTTNSSVNVSGTLVKNGGTLNSTTGTLSFASGGQYLHQVDGGAIATATWNNGSLCQVTGVTSTVPTGLNQSFSDFRWDNAGQAAGLTLNGQLTTVNGNLTINNTNLYSLSLATAANSTYTLQVGNKLQVNANSWLVINGGDNITATVNVGGDFEMTGPLSNSTYFDFYYYSGSSATLNKVIMNVTGDFLLSGGFFDLAYGDSDAAAYNELRLSGDLSVSGNGILTTGTGDNSISNGRLLFTKAGSQSFTATNPANISYVNYQINNGATLRLQSDMLLSSHSTAVWAGQFNVNSGGTVDAGTQRISSSTGTTTGSNNAFTLNSGARIVSSNTAGLQTDATNGTISTAIATRTFNSGADYEFTGAVTGTFTTSPTANTVRNLIVNNASGNVTLSQPLSVTGNLQLTNGILISSMTNLLTLQDNATASAGSYSPARYVDGPIRKIGNDPFTFPVGKAGVYAPASISAPGATNAEYRAEYFRSAPPNRTNITAPGLVKVSLCEYWDIEEVGPGSPVVNVSLSWSGLSPCNAAAYVNDLSYLTVAHFDGTNWNSHDNNGGVSGTAAAGNVTRNTVSSFSIFTLGSTSAVANPLSVKFTNVKAYTSGSHNVVEWTNLSEAGVQNYTVEKSTDGSQFTALTQVAARSNASTREGYMQQDGQPAEKTYYRIKATELSGEVSYSPVVKVWRGEAGTASFSIYPNPVAGKQFTLQYKGQPREAFRLQVINNTGQVVYTQHWIHPGGQAAQSVELPANLSKGMYYLQLSGESRTENRPLVLQ